MALEKVGALWLKDGKKGKFMSGEITFADEPVRVLVFKNTHHKEGDRKPDYEVFVTVDDEKDELPPPASRPSRVDDIEAAADEDIPF